jgi:hypothetical protein
MALSGTTQLEAVNTLLHTIGEAPVNSLTGTLPIDATLALNTINEISREVQSAGWHWNTFYKYALSLDGDSKIPLASNIMRVDLNTGEYPLSSYDVIKRGSFLYNKQGNTFVFDEAVEANVIIYLPFEELPENARRYITIRGSRVFQDRTLGANTLHRFGREDEASALAVLRQEETDTADTNIFNSYDTFNIISRGNKVN